MVGVCRWPKQPLRHQCARGHRVSAWRRHWRALHGPRALLQSARFYGMSQDSSPPAAFHYDRWLGPAPLRPTTKTQSLQLALVLDTGNGDTGNTAAPARYRALGMKKNEHPVTVYSTGDFRFTQDEGKTPAPWLRRRRDLRPRQDDAGDAQHSDRAYTYADGKSLTGDARSLHQPRGSAGQEVGNIFYGTRAGSKSAATPGKPFANGKSKPSRNPRKSRANGPITGRISWRRFAPGKTTTCIATSTKGTSRHRSAISPTSPTASAAR